MWLYYNFFQPVMHLTEKTVVHQENGTTRVKRRHDRAQTPFDRLWATAAIWPRHRQQLDAWRDQTNPRQLRREIHDLLEHIFSLPRARPGVPENVYQTLMPATEIGPDNPLERSGRFGNIIRGGQTGTCTNSSRSP